MTTMKALARGVALGLSLQANQKTITIPAIYSPGVVSIAGRTETWVFWEFTQFRSCDGVPFWSVRAFRRIGNTGMSVPLPLADFDGASGIDSDSLANVLVATGIGLTVVSPQLLQYSTAFEDQQELMRREETAAEVRSAPWYFSTAMANKAQQAAKPPAR